MAEKREKRTSRKLVQCASIKRIAERSISLIISEKGGTGLFLVSLSTPAMQMVLQNWFLNETPRPVSEERAINCIGKLRALGSAKRRHDELPSGYLSSRNSPGPFAAKTELTFRRNREDCCGRESSRSLWLESLNCYPFECAVIEEISLQFHHSFVFTFSSQCILMIITFEYILIFFTRNISERSIPKAKESFYY